MAPAPAPPARAVLIVSSSYDDLSARHHSTLDGLAQALGQRQIPVQQLSSYAQLNSTTTIDHVTSFISQYPESAVTVLACAPGWLDEDGDHVLGFHDGAKPTADLVRNISWAGVRTDVVVLTDDIECGQAVANEVPAVLTSVLSRAPRTDVDVVSMFLNELWLGVESGDDSEMLSGLALVEAYNDLCASEIPLPE